MESTTVDEMCALNAIVVFLFFFFFFTNNRNATWMLLAGKRFFFFWLRPNAAEKIVNTLLWNHIKLKAENTSHPLSTYYELLLGELVGRTECDSYFLLFIFFSTRKQNEFHNKDYLYSSIEHINARCLRLNFGLGAKIFFCLKKEKERGNSIQTQKNSGNSNHGTRINVYTKAIMILRANKCIDICCLQNCCVNILKYIFSWWVQHL